jgi:acetyl-CoA acyltransferase
MKVRRAVQKKGEEPYEEDAEVSRDECNRPDTTLPGLASLKPSFKPDGTVTAGNASQLSDGASACLLMSADRAKQLGLTPLGIYRGTAVAGCEPDEMGIGPVYAVPKLLKKQGVSLGQIDVIELNEAFAAQSLSVLGRLGLAAEDERVNPNGGAIALGHPLGCTGAKLAATAIHELARRRGRYAMVTMCIGLGMGAAGVFERLD